MTREGLMVVQSCPQVEPERNGGVQQSTRSIVKMKYLFLVHVVKDQLNVPPP